MSFSFDALIDAITPRQIDVYLQIRGWVQAGGIKAPLKVFRKSDVDVDIYYSDNIELTDYRILKANAIRQIQIIERVPLNHLVYELFFPNADILRVRIVNENVKYGSIEFKEALKKFESMKDALYSVALSIIEPKKYHKRMSNQLVDKFVESCRFGQTEKGSYVATLICPLKNDLVDEAFKQLAMFPEIEPVGFQRQITTGLMKATQRVVKSIEAGFDDELLEESQENLFVSSNLCAAIRNLGADGSDVELTLSGAIDANPIDTVLNAVLIKKEMFPRIDQIATKLIPAEKPIDTKFVGVIYELRKDIGGEELFEGHVMFDFRYQEKDYKARVALRPDDHKLACDAYRDNKSVLLAGKLEKIGARYYINEYALFKVIE